jgi:cell division septal protein FtsQ
MKGLPPGRGREPAARRAQGSRPNVPARPRDAALGRETRGLVGRARRGARSTPTAGRGIRALTFGPVTPRAVAALRARLRAPGRIVTPARAGGLLGMLAFGYLYSLATGPTAFGLSRTEMPVLRWTATSEVEAALAPVAGSNVFRLDTAPLEASLLALPAVASAEVSVTLPDAAMVVQVAEREPVLAWQIGDRRFIADREGVVFAEVAEGATLPTGVAVIEDRRQGAIDLVAVGGRLDAVDLDVATRLGSLVPVDVGSNATSLRVAVTDDDGFVVSTARGWTAVFGFYSPATRATDLIPGQVRLLRSLLAGREGTVARIILASATDGTYVPRASP